MINDVIPFLKKKKPKQTNKLKKKSNASNAHHTPQNEIFIHNSK